MLVRVTQWFHGDWASVSCGLETLQALKKKKKIEGRTESYRCLKPLGFVTSLAKALSFAMGTYEVVNCFYSSSGGNMDSSEKPCTMCTDLHIKKLWLQKV